MVLHYRFPRLEQHKLKTSRFNASHNQKRTFFEWARKFLVSVGVVNGEEFESTLTLDERELQKLDESILLGEAILLYLKDCEQGNRWMKRKSPVTISGSTRPVLLKFEKAFHSRTPITEINGDRIAEFVRGLGGKKETKERHLCPISNFYTWAPYLPT